MDEEYLRTLLPASSTTTVNCTTEQRSNPDVRVHNLVLTFPPLPPWSPQVLPQLAFAFFWNGFLFVWITTAWRGGAPLLFLCFSVPFVFVGMQLVQLGFAPLLVRSVLSIEYSITPASAVAAAASTVSNATAAMNATAATLGTASATGVVSLAHSAIIGTQYELPVLDLANAASALLHCVFGADTTSEGGSTLDFFLAQAFPPPTSSDTRAGNAAVLSIAVERVVQRQHRHYDHQDPLLEVTYTQSLQLTPANQKIPAHSTLPKRSFKFGERLAHTDQQAVMDVVRTWLEALAHEPVDGMEGAGGSGCSDGSGGSSSSGSSCSSGSDGGGGSGRWS
jgi:uncharacterized membrane protein YgcG